jgi:beta-lactam-binding protein with PASTA domain
MSVLRLPLDDPMPSRRTFLRRALSWTALAAACAAPAAAHGQDSLKAPATVVRPSVRQAPAATTVRQAPAATTVRRDTQVVARPGGTTLSRPSAPVRQDTPAVARPTSPAVARPNPTQTTRPGTTVPPRPNPTQTGTTAPTRPNPNQTGTTVPARPNPTPTPRPGTTAPARPNLPVQVAQDTLVVVPPLSGITVEDARGLLKESGLAVGALDEARGRGVPGTVMRQSPRAGSRVEPGTAVGMTIVEGRRAVMPAIMGLPLERAQRMLAEAGLRTGEINGTDFTSATRVRGHTFRAGERVRAGQAVNLWLELPEAAPGPKVAQAEPAIPPPDPPPPTPQRPRPRPGQPARTQPGAARVDSAAVPDVRRLALEQARAALAGAGFAAAIDPVFADSAGWTVASQEPAAGARVPAGGAIALTLAAPLTAVAGPVAAVPVVPPPPQGGQPAGAGEPAGRTPPGGVIPWILLAVLVLAAAAAYGMRRAAAAKNAILPPLRVELRTQPQPTAAVAGEPFKAGRLRMRLQSGAPTAAVAGAGPLFVNKEVAGG